MAEYKNVENIRNLFDEEFKKTRQLIQQGETHLDNLAEGFLEADRVLFRIPAADVVKVVRCKDCKHWGGITFGNICRRWTGLNVKNCTKPTDFCSYGELKECEGK